MLSSMQNAKWKSAKAQNCNNAQPQKCKSAKVQKCKSAKVQKYKSTKTSKLQNNCKPEECGQDKIPTHESKCVNTLGGEYNIWQTDQVQTTRARTHTHTQTHTQQCTHTHTHTQRFTQQCSPAPLGHLGQLPSSATSQAALFAGWEGGIVPRATKERVPTACHPSTVSRVTNPSQATDTHSNEGWAQEKSSV